MMQKVHNMILHCTFGIVSISDKAIESKSHDSSRQQAAQWPTPTPKKMLLCAWHVDMNWRRGLHTHLKGNNDMADIYTILKTPEIEAEESTFRKNLQ